MTELIIFLLSTTDLYDTSITRGIRTRNQNVQTRTLGVLRDVGRSPLHTGITLSGNVRPFGCKYAYPNGPYMSGQSGIRKVPVVLNCCIVCIPLGR